MNKTMVTVACAAVLMTGCGAPRPVVQRVPAAAHAWVPAAHAVNGAELYLGVGVESPQLQSAGPVPIEPATGEGRAVVSKLLGWLRNAKRLRKRPTPLPSFGIHDLVLSLRSGKSISVSQFFVAGGSGGFSPSQSIVLVSGPGPTEAGWYRDPSLARWRDTGWSADAQRVGAGWTCASATPPNGHLNQIGGAFRDGVRWIVAADAAQSCVVLYTGKDGAWKRETVATNALSDAGAYVEKVQFLDPLHGLVLVGGSPGAGQLTRALYATQDGGATWRSLPVDGAQPFPGSDTLVNMRFTSPADGWLTTLNTFYSPARVYLYRTTDGGRHWSQTYFQLPPDVQSIGSAEVSAPTFRSPLDGSIEVITQWKGLIFFYTTDVGKRWTFDALGNG